MPNKSPDAFRTISEVAEWLNTPAHVLRFWESKFSQVKPVKRAGGRRYYRPVDMALIGGIKKLLHDDGMTIKGVQKVLREQGIKYVSSLSPPLDEDLEAMIAPEPAPTPPTPETGQVLDFSSRQGPASGDDEAGSDETSAPVPHYEPPVAQDLFHEDGDQARDTTSPGAATEEAPDPEHDTTAPPAASEEAKPELPEMPETPDPDESRADIPEPHIAAAVPQETAPQSITAEPDAPAPLTDTADHLPVDAASADAPQAAPEDLPDFLQKPMSERLAEDADAKPEGAETAGGAEQAQDASADHAAADPEPPTRDAADDDTGQGKPALPVDPEDHELSSSTGPLTLLTSPEMRCQRHSAERIETLIIRVRNHQRAMSLAARA